MLAIVKFPKYLTKQNNALYQNSAKIIYQRVRQLKRIEKVIAFGPFELRSLWQGDCWLTQKALTDNLFQIEKEPILIVGLEAPLLSKHTGNDFIRSGYKHYKKQNGTPFCTFRQTPPQNNPATIEQGGSFVGMISQGALNVSMATDANNKTSIQKLEINFLNNELIISSEKGLRITKSKPGKECLNTTICSAKTSQQEIQSSEETTQQMIEFANDDIITISEDIEEPKLYRSIHYVLPPLLIKDVLTTIDGTRINQKTGEKIVGRQAFPEIYEPFSGMMLADNSEISKILLQGDNWFTHQKHLASFIVNDLESKLISEDALFIKAHWEMVTTKSPRHH